MTRRILVTGAAGFSGAHLARRLRRDAAATLVGLDRRFDAMAASCWDEVIEADLRDPSAVTSAIRGARPGEVYHLAGAARGSEDVLREVNVDGTRNLLAALIDAAADASILVVGSAAEYGRAALRHLPLTESAACEPMDGYGRTKHEAVLLSLEMAAAAGLRLTVARPFNIVGAGVPPTLVVGAAIERLRELLASGERELRMGNLDTERDFVAVEDVVDGYVAMIRGDAWGQVLNLASGVPRSIRLIVDTLIHVAGADVEVVVDQALVRASDIPVSYGSAELAKRLCGFTPIVPFDDALRRAWQAAASRPLSSAAP